MTALLNIGGQEMLVLLVIGLLIFGRRLPEVGRSLGKTVAQLRRGLQDFKGQMDRDEDLKDIRGSLREVKRAVDAPRMLANPGRMLRNLTDEALSSPGPEADADPGVPEAGTDATPADPAPETGTGDVTDPSTEAEAKVAPPDSGP